MGCSGFRAIGRTEEHLFETAENMNADSSSITSNESTLILQNSNNKNVKSS